MGTAGVRGRGNSTWQQEKKPYNIKFDKKVEILGMNKSKHWILLANAYYDRTQLHNATAFEVARITDFPWIQSGEFVELFINGEHLGLYYLCEKICVEKNRIDIVKGDESTPVDECGYLLESYYRQEADQDLSKVVFPFGFFSTGIFYKTGNETFPGVYGWEIKEPDNILSPIHIEYIKSSLTTMEELIMYHVETGEYRDYFDIETAINWWMVQELCMNEEASRTKNTFLYKDGGGKFMMGPPWDFDAWTFGQTGLYNRIWSLNYTLYFEKLFEDPIFVERLKYKWDVYKPLWETIIPEFIEKKYNQIHRAAERNEKMWPNWTFHNKYPQVSYYDYIQEMKKAFMLQLELLDNKIKAL